MAPDIPIRFSVREFLIAIAGFALILGGFTSFGMFGACCAALVVGTLFMFCGRKTNRNWMLWSGFAIILPAICTLGCLLAGWLVFGTGPVLFAARHPTGFTQMVRVADTNTQESKIFCLGKFLDSEHVWRLKLEPEGLDLLISHYGLVPVTSDHVPPDFGRLFPHWWQPQQNKQSRYLATPSFPAGSRGPDGDHCFTMYDSQDRYLYVWHKSNF